MSLRKKVIVDCDNTIGLKDKDVDDGLALLYLLGRQDVELAAVTVTFGNSTIMEVYNNTITMFQQLNIKGIPVFMGSEKGHERISDAAAFLSKAAAETPGEITILATGSLSNLYGAYLMDNSFFENLKDIVIMGGITGPLLLNGFKLDELNFSCDSEAAFMVLNSNCNITVLTGNTCLQAYFEKTELDRLQDGSKNNIFNYIAKNIEPWYEYNEKTFGQFGFYNWDIAAAVYITNPELFQPRYKYINSSIQDLEKGLIISAEVGCNKINIPDKIHDRDKFKEVIFDAWSSIDVNVVGFQKEKGYEK